MSSFILFYFSAQLYLCNRLTFFRGFNRKRLNDQISSDYIYSLLRQFDRITMDASSQIGLRLSQNGHLQNQEDSLNSTNSTKMSDSMTEIDLGTSSPYSAVDKTNVSKNNGNRSPGLPNMCTIDISNEVLNLTKIYLKPMTRNTVARKCNISK